MQKDKYLYYIRTVNKKKLALGETGDEVEYLTKENILVAILVYCLKFEKKLQCIY